jgi:hypothetical protein
MVVWYEYTVTKLTVLDDEPNRLLPDYSTFRHVAVKEERRANGEGGEWIREYGQRQEDRGCSENELPFLLACFGPLNL